MDHGRADNRRTTLYLRTEEFSIQECYLLQSVLEKLGIESTVVWRPHFDYKDSFHIKISDNSLDKVISLVSPYMETNCNINDIGKKN